MGGPHQRTTELRSHVWLGVHLSLLAWALRTPAPLAAAPSLSCSLSVASEAGMQLPARAPGAAQGLKSSFPPTPEPYRPGACRAHKLVPRRGVPLCAWPRPGSPCGPGLTHLLLLSSWVGLGTSRQLSGPGGTRSGMPSLSSSSSHSSPIPSLSVSNWALLMTVGQLSVLSWCPSPSLWEDGEGAGVTGQQRAVRVQLSGGRVWVWGFNQACSWIRHMCP